MTWRIIIWLNCEDIRFYDAEAVPSAGDYIRYPPDKFLPEDPEQPDLEGEDHVLRVERVVWIPFEEPPQAWLYCSYQGRGDDDGMEELTGKLLP